jgi:hypothetical protein
MEKLYSEAFIEQALIKVHLRIERTIQSVAEELNMNCHTAKKFDETNCRLFFHEKKTSKITKSSNYLMAGSIRQHGINANTTW